MKKFLSWLGCTLIAVILATAGATALLSCEGGPKLLPSTKVKAADVETALDSIVNPTFTSYSDVIECQKTLKTNAFVDSVFLAMPPNIIKNVYTVLSKKITFVQKSDIVGEFLSNRQIYDNLPPPSPDDNVAKTDQTTTITTTTPTKIPGVVHEETTTVTEAPPTRVEENLANSYKDTTINGKKALISVQ